VAEGAESWQAGIAGRRQDEWVPHAAILAVDAVRRVPVVGEDGQLVAGTRMKATTSADHRVTDCAKDTRFLCALKAVLERPMRLVL
jgi:pyruvate dehydrogenase E2 component (dihydrolipoamide acetyltransferase)